MLLLGASGSGKSTLLAALAGVLGDEEDGEQRGLLAIDGVAPRDARGRAGLVLQDPSTQVVLARVGDEVAFGPENLGVAPDEIRRRVPEALATVGLDLPLDAATSRLSGGQQQRLALAAVLAMRPGLLLLDEPTANLDPEGVLAVRDAVLAAAASTGATLVVVEHRVATWAGHLDRVVVLGPGGRVLADGAPARILAERGPELAAAGVWVPGLDPSVPPPGQSGPALLRTHDLVVERGRTPVRAVGDLEVPEGALVALTGPNGVGKTTLALTLGGLLPPYAGTVSPASALADGLTGPPWRWRSRELLPRIGVVLQSPQHSFLTARVRDELAVGLVALRRPAGVRTARVEELLERLGLRALADANPFTLSGGQQRRLSVGAALAAAPRLIVLDEPTFGQDATTWAALVGLLMEAIGSGSGVVAATHDPALAAGAAARIALQPAVVPA